MRSTSPCPCNPNKMCPSTMKPRDPVASRSLDPWVGGVSLGGGVRVWGLEGLESRVQSLGFRVEPPAGGYCKP